ncbi:hypothetical protein CCB81_05055 [Armatimonadetes bacterium Uphvl-Ar2]|nr:hypothetical protein CCB81_05055 [Armatimonadetes bacterium Uphvl-Ar2]
MKVFISWSGEETRRIAEALAGWLPNVMQSIKPFISNDDSSKGTRWLYDISSELEATSFGLIVVSPKNKDARWLLFEAGALSKSFEHSRVCPILFYDLQLADIEGPLAQFQAALFTKEEMYKVVQSINCHSQANALTEMQLKLGFEKWWPDLEQDILHIQNESPRSVGQKRSDREVLEEILEISRQMSTAGNADFRISQFAIRDLCIGISSLIRMPKDPYDEESIRTRDRLIHAIQYLNKRARFDSFSKDAIDAVIDDLLMFHVDQRPPGSTGHSES